MPEQSQKRRSLWKLWEQLRELLPKEQQAQKQKDNRRIVVFDNEVADQPDGDQRKDYTNHIAPMDLS